MAKKLNEEVAEMIRNAFADTPYPGDQNIGIPDPFDGDMVTLAFRGIHWRDISLELLVTNHDKLGFLTEAAYRFYLPAYLLATLAHNFERLDTIPGHIMVSLDPHSLHSRERLERFSPKEKQAIYAYIKSYKQLFPTDNWSVNPSERASLEQSIQFWSDFAIEKG